ncbi:hypothetical protein AAY42_01115 [Flagellimonas eckloniae]|uniref:Uncharacterized protein n=1 Tax=Flagellimonas eckloniae TaxID=346185 RepID=A0A0N8WFG8_9FLAO|nr:hypothetical protein AAY42_01115 [Allomuricauda eckloniae]
MDNFRQLKNGLKPIKADVEGRFLDALLQHCVQLHNAIGKDYSVADHDHMEIRCEVFFNIPLSSLAWIGNGTHRCLQELRKDGNGAKFDTKKELAVYLQGLESIPSIIKPVKMELIQKIGDAKSRFVYELVG